MAGAGDAASGIGCDCLPFSKGRRSLRLTYWGNVGGTLTTRGYRTCHGCASAGFATLRKTCSEYALKGHYRRPVDEKAATRAPVPTGFKSYAKNVAVMG